ncbi:alpha-N-arabinofuranosidase [soil metagenome]
MNHHATVTIDPAFRVGPVPPRLFGSFVEHMGRCVYGGIYDPGHADADGHGFRSDVRELVRELGVSLVRYPGGNFVSGYNWEDGIGPVAERPVRLDRAWRAVETNEVGIDEFMRWITSVGCEPILAVNLGTKGIDEACNLLEYVNHPGGTAWSDLRIENGIPDPYGVKLWCLGNEMDGHWQIGHKTGHEYGRLAVEVARAMRRIDPTIELVACGSSNSSMPTFGAWESDVLEECHDLIDYISLHAYYEQHGDDRASFLASAVDMDRMIEQVTATCDAVVARHGSARRLGLSFDEWNVWYQQRFDGDALTYGRPPALIEDDYSVTDAVVVGGLLVSLLRHADRVQIACQAQLVNVIAPIRTEPGGSAWRQSIYDPFAATARHAQGDVLSAHVDSPLHGTERYGEVPLLDAVATLDDDRGALTVILVNRATEDTLDTHVVTRGLSAVEVVERTQLWDEDHGATNSATAPDRVRMSPGDPVKQADDELILSLPPASWTMVRATIRSNS